MKSIAKLKDRARKHEQKEDWKAAIEAYQKVLQTQEADDAVELELGLYNRVGDLFLRIGQTADAVDYYEQAADRYADSGFFNNAIALCNKALRHRPDRPELYLKLSRFCHEQGFLTDARRWIVEYAERQVKRGAVDDALAGLQEFAEASGSPDVRELVAQHLARHDRQDEAVEQLSLAHAEWARRGDDEAADRVAEQARAMDPDVELDTVAPAPAPTVAGLPGLDEPEERPAPPAPGEPAGDALELETTAYAAADADEDEAAPVDAGLEGLETHRADSPAEPAAEAEAAEEAEEPLPLLDTDADEPEEAEPLPMLETEPGPVAAEAEEPAAKRPEPAEEPAAEEPVAEEPVAEEPVAEEPVAEEPAAEEPVAEEPVAEEPVAEEPAAEEPVAEEPEEELAPLAGLEFGPSDLGGPAEEDEAQSPDELAASLGIEPMDLDMSGLSLGIAGETEPEPAEGSAEDLDVDAVLERAKQLVSRGLMNEAARELRLLSGSHASTEAFRMALSITNEIIRHSPNDISVLQRRVEFAGRIGDRGLMVDTYTDLAEALVRAGSETKSRAMYQRVLDLDPGNSVALEALGEAADTGDEQVDLEALLREMGQDPEAAAAAAAAADETDESFAAMLSQFKARVNDSAASEDAGDHYDLGLAFKEMGLIDEAITEFQTALTGGEERLKVYEELGQCFILKGQYNVALKILKRALKAPHQDKADLLGVYYHIGKCHEELGDRAEARSAYEKVLDINPHFGDVPSRVGRL